MDRQTSLIRRVVPLVIAFTVAASTATASDDRPEASAAKATTGAPARPKGKPKPRAGAGLESPPELNRLVLEFCRDRLGQTVGNGECTMLAHDALQAAGAQRFGWARSGDYVWGTPVESFAEALPGDIVQFRDAVFAGRRDLPGGRWMSWHYEYPHHTAVVAALRGGGREVVVLHQNVIGQRKGEPPSKVVQEGALWPDSLQPGGRVWIYRPVAAPLAAADGPRPSAGSPRRHTEVAISADRFLVNGRPTYEGRTWKGRSIEGLLLNSRMVQGTFDDLEPETRDRWAYPDTGRWDPERNTREFLAAMPDWRRHGLLAFTLNLQGGSPQGYSRGRQPWHNSAITKTGDLRDDYLDRLGRIVDRADELGMAVILGVFYFGQDERLKDEAAVLRALDAAVDWVLNRGYRNVLIEVANECDVRYDHAVLRPERIDELISRVKARTRDGRRLLVGTSHGGGTIPRPNVVRVSDFLLMHGNGVSDPARLAAMVRQARAVEGYRPMPILFNEDDHFDFDRPANHFDSALSEFASWGYFDPGESNYRDGYQSPPVQWGINTDRKRAFFGKLAEITGSAP